MKARSNTVFGTVLTLAFSAFLIGALAAEPLTLASDFEGASVAGDERQTQDDGTGYHPLWRQISGNWVCLNGNPHTVSLCLETMWNYENSTTEGYRAVGSNLAAAVREYLAERPEK